MERLIAQWRKEVTITMANSDAMVSDATGGDGGELAAECRWDGGEGRMAARV